MQLYVVHGAGKKGAQFLHGVVALTAIITAIVCRFRLYSFRLFHATRIVGILEHKRKVSGGRAWRRDLAKVS